MEADKLSPRYHQAASPRAHILTRVSLLLLMSGPWEGECCFHFKMFLLSGQIGNTESELRKLAEENPDLQEAYIAKQKRLKVSVRLAILHTTYSFWKRWMLFLEHLCTIVDHWCMWLLWPVFTQQHMCQEGHWVPGHPGLQSGIQSQILPNKNKLSSKKKILYYVW